MASLIDPTKPADGVPAVKADLRANLQAAKDEIEALQAGGAALPAGGLTGQRLTKLSDSDFDVGWQTPSGAEASHFIYAKDHGAVADGQDRTTELQTAVDTAGGKTLVIEGMIRISSNIRLSADHNGTVIIGAGPSGHGIRADVPDDFSDNQLVLVQGTESNVLTDVTFRHIEIDGRRDESNTGSYENVIMRHVKRVRWENCTIHDNAGDGKTLFSIKGNCEDVWIVNSRFFNASRNAIGTFAQDFTNHPNRRIFIIGNDISVGAETGTDRNCILVSSGGTYTDPPNEVLIGYNRIRDALGNAGIRHGGNNYAVIVGNVFENNLWNIRSTETWEGATHNHTVITGNRFLTSATGSGHIVLRHEAGDMVIANNTFGKPANGEAIAFVNPDPLDEPASLVIEGNTIVDGTIKVERASGSPMHLAIQGNVLRGVTGEDGIKVDNVDNAIVTGNRIDGSGTNGILVSNLDKPIVAHNAITGSWTTPIAQSSVTNEIGIASGVNQT